MRIAANYYEVKSYTDGTDDIQDDIHFVDLLHMIEYVRTICACHNDINNNLNLKQNGDMVTWMMIMENTN